ncbi:ParA family protein [Microbacterium sp.]|uniref:ParA family protein n=1 Tax=Microbacterium sp. TaxID=51671 RepID=UPI0028113951|nr:ParA family protein [Microbacterium sp.]
MFHVKQPEKASPNNDFGMDTPLARELADLSSRRRALEKVTVSFTGETRVFTVSNQKGGVGKTTTAVNLASALAQLGAQVLVVDLDPQGNASTALGVAHSADTPSVYDVLIDDSPFASIVQQSPESPNLFCAPSTIHLAGAEIELVSQVAREFRLRRALESYLAERPIDVVIIDCPPSLGLLTINAFTAASEVLIPIQCEYYALEGLSQLLGSIQMIQKHLNPELHLSTILLTMYDGRTRLAQQVADEVRNHFPQQVLNTVIPRSVRVSEAPSFGQTVIAYDGTSAGAIAYREAAVEIAQRGQATAQDKEK